MNRIPIPLTPDTFKQRPGGVHQHQHHHHEDESEIEMPSVSGLGDHDEEWDDAHHGHDDELHLHPSSSSPSAGGNSNHYEDDEDELVSLEDQASVVTAILKPVAITMVLVIALVYVLNVAQEPTTKVAWMVYQEHSSDSTARKLGGAIINALVFVVLIVVVTVLLVMLYKYRCIKLIYGWLIVSTGLLLGLFGAGLFLMLLLHLNQIFDWPSFLLIVWNFMAVGMVSIFWYAPAKVTQGYLIVISALLALFFTRLPEWTTWAILVAVAIYDLFSVLCPKGPLRILVETAEQRQEPIPALLYSGALFFMGMADDSSRFESDFRSAAQNLSSSISSIAENEDEIILEDEEQSPGRSIKLGLGDFVFYSVLVGRAALYDVITVVSCFIAIITGLFLTLVLLAVFRKALPALPISIGLGTIFFIFTKYFVVPYVLQLALAGVFV